MDLIEITPQKHNIVLDLRYATLQNCIHRAVYDHPIAYLHKAAEPLLIRATQLAAVQNLKLKIWDPYRPPQAQRIFYDNAPNPDIFAHPDKGSPHSRGVAVDLTLIDENEQELDMGTDFDDPTEKAFHANTEISATAQKNRYILLGIMMSAGWDFFDKEWWHYQMFNAKQYPLINNADLPRPIMDE